MTKTPQNFVQVCFSEKFAKIYYKNMSEVLASGPLLEYRNVCVTLIVFNDLTREIRRNGNLFSYHFWMDDFM